MNSRAVDLRKQKVFDMIKSKFRNYTQENNVLVSEKNGITVNVDFGYKNIVKGVTLLQVNFTVTHKYFDEDMIESVAGVGNNVDLALQQATENFMQAVLVPVEQVLEGRDTQTIKTELWGEIHTFEMSDTDRELTTKRVDENKKPLWSLVEKLVPKYLGNKKAYWIKLFVSCSEENSISEARINNILCPELTDILNKYAKEWENRKEYHSEKLFVFMVQADETYKKPCFTRSQIKNFTTQSIKIFEGISSEDDYKNVYDRIYRLMEEKNLATELYLLIPEIYCQMILNVKSKNKIHIIKNNVMRDFNKSQIRSYGYIEEAIFEYVSKKKPTQQQIVRVISCSSTFNAINKSIQHGGKLENIMLSGITYSVDEDYTLY